MTTELMQKNCSGYNCFNYKHIFQSKALFKSIENSNGRKFAFDEAIIDEENPLVFVKYMPLSRLKSAIEGHYIFFSSPKDWEDTFEHLLPDAICDCGTIKDVKCACFTMTDFGNEEGFWKLFRKEDSDPVVAITYNVKNLFLSLDNTGEKDCIDFYLHGVEYKNQDKIIEQIRNLNKRNNTLFKSLSVFSMKRFAFGHERELRFFAVRRDEEISDREKIKKINVDYSAGLIESVTMPPMKPFGYGDVRYNDYVAIQDIHNLELKHQLEEIKRDQRLSFKILQSALYINKTRTEIESLSQDKYSLFDYIDSHDSKNNNK